MAIAPRCLRCHRRSRAGSYCPQCRRLYDRACNSTTKRARARATIAASPRCEICCATTDLTADHVVPVIEGGDRTAPHPLPLMQQPTRRQPLSRLSAQSCQALLNAASMLVGASSVKETRGQSRRPCLGVELLR